MSEISAWRKDMRWRMGGVAGGMTMEILRFAWLGEKGRKMARKGYFVANWGPGNVGVCNVLCGAQLLLAGFLL